MMTRTPIIIVPPRVRLSVITAIMPPVMLVLFQLLSVTRDFPSILTDLRFVPSDFCLACAVPEVLA